MLERLSQDENPVVRAAAAKNPNMPESALERLSQDKDRDVRGFAKTNLALKKKDLKLGSSSPVHSIDLTPQLKRDLLKQGQPIASAKSFERQEVPA
jgi:hypothetical protein